MGDPEAARVFFQACFGSLMVFADCFAVVALLESPLRTSKTRIETARRVSEVSNWCGAALKVNLAIPIYHELQATLGPLQSLDGLGIAFPSLVVNFSIRYACAASV